MLDSALFRKHLEKEEKVTMIVHRHVVLGIVSLFWPTVAFATCWIVFAKAPHTMILYLALFASAASALWWMRNFLDYYLDAWMVTDQGVIDLEWMGLFHRKSTRILYSDIQGVSYEMQGIGGTLLRYGTITIEKVSTGGTIMLPHVSHPKDVSSAILRTQEEYLTKKNLKNAKHVQEILATVVAEQFQLQGVKKKEAIVERKKGFTSKSIRSS